MGRRSRKKYIDYDYEAAYEKQLSSLEQENEERLRQTGVIRCTYATKEVRSGDQLEVEIYPEFEKGKEPEIPDAGKRERQRKAQRNLNEKNSRKMCERLINENFTDRDIWATLTYTDENAPETMEEAKANMQKYIKRLNYRRRKAGLPNTRYIYITECSEKGRWHHHIVMDGGLDMDTVENVWILGIRNQVRRLQRDKDGLVGMSRYITKDKSQKGKYQKCWTASKGLRRPKETVNHYKTLLRDVIRMVKGELHVAEHLEKWYSRYGYEYAESEIRYNTFNGQFYIYGRMRRANLSEETGSRKKRRQERGR